MSPYGLCRDAALRPCLSLPTRAALYADGWAVGGGELLRLSETSAREALCPYRLESKEGDSRKKETRRFLWEALGSAGTHAPC